MLKKLHKRFQIQIIRQRGLPKARHLGRRRILHLQFGHVGRHRLGRWNGIRDSRFGIRGNFDPSARLLGLHCDHLQFVNQLVYLRNCFEKISFVVVSVIRFRLFG